MEPGTQEWLDQVVEPIVDPDREIIDPHHHLWPPGTGLRYGNDELAGDTTAGHRVVATVFVECRAAYRREGPEHLRPVGETEFVAASADALASGHPDAPPIAGIVAHADLADAAHLDEVLDAHEEAAGGRFRGIRDALARSIEPEAHRIPASYAAGKFEDAAFRAGVARLGERGLTYDSWHFHYQNREFLALAQAVPGTTMILDHFGTPVGVGRFAGCHDDYFEQWKLDIADIAACGNTVAKLGGLIMPDNGFGFDTAPVPPTSDQFLEVQRRWYEHTIECFGPERCMFESNFPVDRLAISYGVLWNAFKRLASQYSESERELLFAGTARRVYRL
ncbi:MAG: amidohydrolase family protein [Ilumatobacter sp.]|jgi:L-fuconolactonase|uniref:amidohydrolase family protein n=1 Tax=Ilumatobacter sp. TaxID=1967498 RepID=UPI00391934D4